MTRIYYLITLLFLCNASFGQTYTGRAASNFIAGADKVIIDESTKLVQYASFENKKNGVTPDNAAQWIISILDLEDEYGFERLRSMTDQLGITHTKYQQTLHQVPIENAILTAHGKADGIASVSGVYFNTLKLASINPAYSKAEAIIKAKEITKAKVYHWKDADFPAPQLVVFTKDNKTYLTYKVDVFAIEPMSRNYLFLDAFTGELIETYQSIHGAEAEGIAQTRYSGERTIITDSISPNEYILLDNSRGNGILTQNIQGGTSYTTAIDITDADNFWILEDHYANAALDAHWGAEMTYDFYFETFGRNSYDNEGATIISYVNYGGSDKNAFWNGVSMNYGIGSGLYGPHTAIDIVGHEFTHGVTRSSAGLIYEGQSGALNESFSNIFGVAINFYARPDQASYTLGADIGPTPLISLKNPKQYGSPDTYYGDYWAYGPEDHWGVHTNAGVLNYWYYLLSEGGSGINDDGNSYHITPIGREAATAIAYRMLTVYLTPTSKYVNAHATSIVAAADLYGECSFEAITVAHAWYAVGLGSPIPLPPMPQFEPSRKWACQLPASIHFENYSVNGLSYIWDFGDGNTSIETSPTHTYSDTGLYTVTLHIEGLGECGTDNELVRTDLIRIDDSGGPIPPTCEPETMFPNANYGIKYFQFNTIEYSSGPSLEGYSDFTCNATTTLIEGTAYPFAVHNFASHRVEIWIDLNNDGSFSSSERIFQSDTHRKEHFGMLLIPEASAYNTPLRMRVRSIAYEYDSLYYFHDACSPLVHGQVEDYQVVITENLNPPIAQFSVLNHAGQVGEQIAFTDLSLNVPETYEWVFEGGTPSTSSDQNPTVTYGAIGTYDVTLIVTNSYGADTLTFTDYISIVNTLNMCATAITVAQSGILYDSGGPDGEYQNKENCSLLIAPSCAISVTLSFDNFSTGYYHDELKIYDGSNSSAPLLASLTGTLDVNDITSSSGAMFLVFKSNDSNTFSGWEASWTSETPSTMPIANFDISDSNPPLNTEIDFTDLSTEYPSDWIWDFGDGIFATVQNPSHTYSLAGTYNVSLVVSNCFSTDTVSQSIVVQDAPGFSISLPDTIHASINCGGSVDTTFTIYNTGNGDLMVEAITTNIQNGFEPKVLALITGTDYAQYANTVNAINTHFTAYTISETHANNSEDLEAALVGIDILLIPRQAYGNSFIFQAISEALLSFVNQGGQILICGSGKIASTGLFHSGTGSAAFNLNISNVYPDHPIMNGVPETFSGIWATIGYNWSNDPDVEILASISNHLNYAVVAEKVIGDGKVIYVGYDYSNISEENSRIIGRSMNYLASSNTIQWSDISLVDSTVIIPPGDSLVVSLSLNAEELFPGDYALNMQTSTNDSYNLITNYTLHLNVTGFAELAVDTATISFNTMVAGNILQDTVIIANAGCDSLMVNAALYSSIFSVSPTDLVIQGYEQDTLFVNFLSEEPGIYSEELFLTSNGGDQNISLFAEALDPPEITINPADTLHIQTSCSTTDSVTFTIFNNGLGSLELYGQFHVSDNLNVLALTTHANLDNQYANTIEAINNHFTNYTLTTSNSSNSASLSSDLEGVDILIIPRQIGVNSLFFALIREALEDFVSDGGQILMCANQHMTYSGLFTPNSISGPTMPSIHNFAPDHLIMSNLPNDFSAPTSTLAYNWTTNNEIETLAISSDYNSNYSVVAVKEIGLGKVVYVGFDYYTVSVHNSLIIGNAMQFLAQQVLPDWVEDIYPDLPATILPGDSIEISVVFNSEGLIAGNYYGGYNFYTNDPQNDSINFVIHLEVAGSPLLDVSEDEIMFDPIMVGETATDTILIYNNGCTDMIATLELSDSNFSASPTYFAIPPFSHDTIFVIFQPTEVGLLNVTIELLSNGNDTLIGLTGEGLSAPLMVLIPDEVFANPETCADSILVSFTIQNNGEGLLEYGIFRNPDDLDIETILSNLTSNYSDITAWIPDIHLFFGGEYGNYISDGGNDMYDISNRLRTNLQPPLTYLQYTSSNIHEETAFGEGARYFTAKFPGLFVLVADMNEVESFAVTGNLGADGMGYKNDVIMTYNSLIGVVYKAFVTRVFDAGNASVNHMIIVKDNMGIGHTYDPSTENENHVITGLINNTRLYYLLFSSYPGLMIADEYLENMFETFITHVQDNNLANASISGEIEPGENSQISFYLHISEFESGDYDVPVLVHSNDPLNPIDTLIVHLSISGNVCPNFNYISENSCGDLSFTDQSTNNPTSWSWNFGNGSSSDLQNPIYNYSEIGEYSVSLEACNDLGCNTVSQTITVENVSSVLPVECIPYADSSTSINYITLFGFNGQSFPSGESASGYQDFTCDPPLTADIGVEYQMSIQVSSNSYYQVRAWIDYNNDGQFTSNELILSSNNIQDSITVNLTIPEGTLIDTPLRLRILADETLTEPCGILSDGEAEDYAIIISAPNSLPQFSENSISIFPNPSNGVFTILYPENLNLKEILMYNALGQRMEVESQTINQGEVKITLNRPATGVYMIFIRTKSGTYLRSRLIID